MVPAAVVGEPVGVSVGEADGEALGETLGEAEDEAVEEAVGEVSGSGFPVQALTDTASISATAIVAALRMSPRGQVTPPRYWTPRAPHRTARGRPAYPRNEQRPGSGSIL